MTESTELKAVIHTGALLANAAFNLAQRAGSALSDRECEALEEVFARGGVALGTPVKHVGTVGHVAPPGFGPMTDAMRPAGVALPDGGQHESRTALLRAAIGDEWDAAYRQAERDVTAQEDRWLRDAAKRASTVVAPGKLADGVALGVPRLHASRVDALIAVLEGECDGLAVTRETAEAIMHYLDGNAPPEWKETALRLWDSSKGYYTEWSNDTPDVLRAEFVKLLDANGVMVDAPARPRALTQFELLHARDNHPVGMTPEESAIRKFCEVNGLTYGVPGTYKDVTEDGNG